MLEEGGRGGQGHQVGGREGQLLHKSLSALLVLCVTIAKG